MSLGQRRRWHPSLVLLPGKPHGWRSLVGSNPRGHEESDTTEWLHFHFSLSCIGEGNRNLLQCSFLENPRDGGAWEATIYGVAQSWTPLKCLSSSSSRKSLDALGEGDKSSQNVGHLEKQRRGPAVGVESENRLWEKHGQKAGLEVGRWGTSAQWYPYS